MGCRSSPRPRKSPRSTSGGPPGCGAADRAAAGVLVPTRHLAVPGPERTDPPNLAHSAHKRLSLLLLPLIRVLVWSPVWSCRCGFR
jgi:hypothetical protein